MLCSSPAWHASTACLLCLASRHSMACTRVSPNPLSSGRTRLEFCQVLEGRAQRGCCRALPSSLIWLPCHRAFPSSLIWLPCHRALVSSQIWQVTSLQGCCISCQHNLATAATAASHLCLLLSLHLCLMLGSNSRSNSRTSSRSSSSRRRVWLLPVWLLG